MSVDTQESWRPVASLPGYEASDLGRIRSRRTREHDPHLLVSSVGPCGFLTVTVYLRGEKLCRRVGTMVAEAWIGARPAGAEIRRLDGVTINDRAENLAYGSLAQVMADHRRRARREEALGADTHCPVGHRYADSWLGNWGERLCLDCRRNPKPAYTDCVGCGSVGSVPQIVGSSGPLRLKCDDCQKAARLDPKPEFGDCHECGLVGVVRQLVGSSGPLRRYCDSCARARRLNSKPEYTDCRDCGAVGSVPQVVGSSGGLRTRCDDCARREAVAANRRAYLKRRTPATPWQDCIDCGTPVEQNDGPGHRIKRCDPCRVLAQREAERRYRQRNRAPRKVREAECRDCGQTFEVTGPGPLPTRCPVHKREARAEALRRHEAKRRQTAERA